MSDFGKFCELCEREDDFKCGCDDGCDTTKMEVKYDGKTYGVLVCTNCEDEATPKAIREKIKARFAKYEKLVEDAKACGVELDIEALMAKQDGLVVATPKTEETIEVPRPAQGFAAAPAPIQKAMPQVEEERLLDEQGNRIRQQQIKSKEMQIVEANLHGSGRPIALPKKEVGNTGTTYYQINRVTDADLQNRFRKQAARSQQNPNAPSEYRPCTSCGGEGHTVKMVKGKKEVQICKICDGVGLQQDG